MPRPHYCARLGPDSACRRVQTDHRDSRTAVAPPNSPSIVARDTARFLEHECERRRVRAAVHAPERLVDLISARLDRLSMKARRVLQALAVLGEATPAVVAPATTPRAPAHRKITVAMKPTACNALW